MLPGFVAPAMQGTILFPAFSPAEGMPVAKLEIPRLNVSVVVLEGVGDSTLQIGAGHVPETALPGSAGVLAEPLINQGTRRHFMRVAVDRSGRVRPTGMQASHRLSSLGEANGLVDVPPDATYPAGATVSILHWD